MDGGWWGGHGDAAEARARGEVGRACLARVRPDGVWTWRDGAGVDSACENVVMGNESDLCNLPTLYLRLPASSTDVSDELIKTSSASAHALTVLSNSPKLVGLKKATQIKEPLVARFEPVEAGRALALLNRDERLPRDA